MISIFSLRGQKPTELDLALTQPSRREPIDQLTAEMRLRLYLATAQSHLRLAEALHASGEINRPQDLTLLRAASVAIEHARSPQHPSWLGRAARFMNELFNLLRSVDPDGPEH